MDDPHFISGQTLVLLERCGLSPRNVVFELTERTSIEDFWRSEENIGPLPQARHYGQGYLLGKPMRRAACDREATLRSVIDGES
jgi:EAL domain-containing protein (putative c-di-GMP-specific phosphodiesterase class I)